MEKVSSNVDILYIIFEYLNLEEHIKLTKVCTQFRTVVIDFMWRKKYTKLEIFKTSENYILTDNIRNDMEMEGEAGYENIREVKTVINNKDFKKFLQLIVNNIEVLVLSSPITTFIRSLEIATKSSSLFISTEFGVEFNTINKLRNLTAITFKYVILTENDFKLLTRNCTKLENLCLDNCLNNKQRTLVIGQDIKVATIQKITGLKYFEIKATFYVDKDLYYELNDILTKLNKKKLIIKVHNFSISETEDTDNDKGSSYADFLKYYDKKFALSNPCEELSIGYFRSRRIFNKFNKTILNNFKNLKKLTMESYAGISINEEFFDKLSKTCKQLKALKLIYFEINNFIQLETLNDLVLENCSGLTWQDLKLILSNMKLINFSISDTEYVGRFVSFKITPTLEYIQVDNCQRCHFKKLFEINYGDNLKHISSFNWYSNFAEVPLYIATSGDKIKYLITEPSNFLIYNLYSMKSLEKLVFKVKRKIKFSNILTILKHPCLVHFTIIKMESSDDDYDEYNDYLIDCDIDDHELLALEDMKTNLSFLNITLNSYFKITQDFWFNLLSNNPKLLLMIRYNRFIHTDHSFLKFIIGHRKFPRRLKSINICGYNIELREFKENIEAVIDKINSFSCHYKVQQDNGYILL